MKFYDGYIGQEYAGQTLKFVPGDDQKTYEKHLEEFDKDWYYRNVDILYQYNNLGHRCKNIKDIDLANYILFTGCSHTEGVGLKLESSFPYLVSTSLNIDYYNLGLSSSGLDVLFHNLSLWLIRNKHPKCIVVQWPDEYRFTTKKEYSDYIVPHGSWDIDDDVKDFIITGDKIEYFQSRKRYVAEFLKGLSIPIINISCGRPLNNCNNFTNLDYARDQKHFGINSHINMTTTILEQIDAKPFT